MISNVVFVVENAIIDKEMHSHKLSAMADNYPADWCINQVIWSKLVSYPSEYGAPCENSFGIFYKMHQTLWCDLCKLFKNSERISTLSTIFGWEQD